MNIKKIVVPSTVVVFLLAYTKHANSPRVMKDILWVLALIFALYVAWNLEIEKTFLMPPEIEE